jgi:WD40 repeat protein
MSCSEEVKDYGKIHEKYISSMVVTRDNSFLITASADCHVKKISIVNKQVLVDFGSMTNSWISTIQASFDDENLWIYEDNTYLKLIRLRDGKVIQHFRKHNGEMRGRQGAVLTTSG